MNPHPFTKAFGVGPNVHGHIKHLPKAHAHQFALWFWVLKMQAPQNTFGRSGVVVLNEGGRDARCFFKVACVEALKKEAPLVTKNLGF